MAGFEIVVRPVIFPNIRPAPARSLPSEDDPEKGFTIIHANGAQQVGLSLNWNASASKNDRNEIERTVDKVRVYQMEDDNTVNRDNFVDINVTKKIAMEGNEDVIYEYSGADELPGGDNIEITERNKVIKRRI